MRALVTGGTRGIGAAIATLLKKSGHEVWISGTVSRDCISTEFHYLACDFSKKENLESFANEVAGLEFSILVNNAGINKIGLVSEYKLADFIKLHQVNVVAPFVLCKEVVPGMCQRGFGRIVNITSIFSEMSKVGRAAYSASKCAVVGFSQALALEVAKDNVLVNCLALGFVKTDLTKNILGEEGMKEMETQIPLGRMASPEEVANYVLFLVSKDNGYMTGQNIIVDGGFVCG